MAHMTHYTKAIAFIQDHGHFAAITKDGLLALSWLRDTAPHCDDDPWCEEPTVFEVDDAGMVESHCVRSWLGY